MKLHKFNKRNLVTFFDTKKPIDLPEYKYDENKVRGVWVSNVANIDTPIMQDVESYKEYLVKMVENIASYNMNTIIFQVRPTNDAYYKSKLNPWSKFITGEEGKDPGFDVLEFVINEAKKYGIQVHAWMNPYRVGMKPLQEMGLSKEQYLETLAPNNYARLHPEDTTVDGLNKVILKPASDSVIKFVADTIMEVVDNYDVTGVHIDDYFYPYAKIPYEEEKEDYELALKNNPELTFDDWRRNNVDKMIQSIHDGLKKSFSKTGKLVEFGISPFAIYRTHISLKENGWEKGSYNTPGCLQCYSELYSDIYKWMKEGWIDYVVPQVYFPFERKDVTYHDLVKWWNERAGETNTKLYIGQGIYQMGATPFWSNPLEIDNQLRFNQNFENVGGTIFFTYKDFVPGQNTTKNAAIALVKARWNQAKIQEKIQAKLNEKK